MHPTVDRVAELFTLDTNDLDVEHDQGGAAADVLEVVPSGAELLRQQGYRPGAPARVTARSLAADAEAAADYPCPDCGHAGMRAVPYHRGASYRCLLACPHCGGDTAEL